MQIALGLAIQGRFSTSPNPRVGCVITRGNQIIGQGFHLKTGEPHAEIHALKQAGLWAKGATAYVTLEPCSHHGRTGPCADALIAAGVARVVVAMYDPNPQVSGQGVARLRQADIVCEVGLLADEARELNRAFLSRIERGRPFIRLKVATSLDSKTALSDGQSRWITGEAARADVQILRAESCAILTGIGTVLTDNPRLNIRTFPVLRQPVRIVLDSCLRTPLSSALVTDDSSPTLIATCVQDKIRYEAYLRHAHVQILCVAADQSGRINLNELMPRLAQMGYGEILVEGGANLNTELLRQNWVDEVVLYQAPKILGHHAKAAFRLPETTENLLRNDWQTKSIEQIGDDIKWILAKCE